MTMISVEMLTDHDVKTSPHSCRNYKAGKTYHGILKNHAQAIVKAGAGKIVPTPAAIAGEAGNDGNAVTETRTGKRRRRQT